MKILFGYPDSLQILNYILISLERRQMIKKDRLTEYLGENTSSTFNTNDTGDYKSIEDIKKIIDGLSLSIMLELAHIYPNPATNVILQQKMKISKQNIAYKIKKLESLNFVKKTPNLEDIREKPFVLSQEGINFLVLLNRDLTKSITNM